MALDLGPSIRALYEEVNSRVSSLAFSFSARFCSFPPFPPAPLRHLPLLASPTLPLLLVTAYVLVAAGASWLIHGLRLRPREKEPRLLLAYVAAHNLLLFGLSAFLAISVPLEAFKLGYDVWGNAYNPRETKMAFLIYLFYISKYLEFGDTLIMLLRFSVRQVSFLHVYHHATITLIWWFITFSAPGGDAYYSAFLNSAVHVAMYGYYFLAAVIGRNQKLRAKYLFWGRYLTQMQMLQFVSMMAQAIFLLVLRKPYPTCLSLLLLVYMCTLLSLFAHFYVMKYVFPPRTDLSREAKAVSKNKVQ